MTSDNFPTRLAIKQPFASGDGAELTKIDDASGTSVNYVDGFPSVYGAPASNGGKYVTRGEMNAIGNLASRNEFYRMCGGLNKFDINFCDKIGGYPKGAVLEFITNTNKLAKVVSLSDNNYHNFLGEAGGTGSEVVAGSVDNVYWAYCNTDDYVPVGEVEIGSVEFPGVSSGQNGVMTPFNVYLAEKSGILSIKDSGGDDSETTTSWTTVAPCYEDCGFVARNIGSDPTVSFSWPAWSSLNSFQHVPGLISIGTSGHVVSQTNGSTNWSSSANRISVSAGDYVAIGLITGRSTQLNSSGYTTGYILGSRTFTFSIQ